MEKRTVLVIGMIIFVTCLCLGEEKDGNWWLRTATNHFRLENGAKLSLKEQLDIGTAGDYMDGLLDAISIYGLAGCKQNPVCLPSKGISIGQVLRILKKFLDENPEILHESGRSLVFTALGKTFPCKQ